MMIVFYTFAAFVAGGHVIVACVAGLACTETHAFDKGRILSAMGCSYACGALSALFLAAWERMS